MCARAFVACNKLRRPHSRWHGPGHPDQSVAVRILIRLKYAADRRGNLARHLSTEVKQKGKDTGQRECNRAGLKYYEGLEFWLEL